MSTAAAAAPITALQDKSAVRPVVADVKLSDTDYKIISATSFLSTNVGWEILDLGLKKEKMYQAVLIQSTNEASEIQQTIQKLLELNGQLHLGEKDVVLSDQTLALFKDLEKAKITLLQPGEKKISPTRMSELKAQIGANNDRLKTELQTLFSTKIQVRINEINSLLESLRTTAKYFDRLMSSIIGNQRRQ